MSSQINKVTKSFIRYWDHRTKLKAKYKKLLEEENMSSLIELGKDVYNARESGYKIEEIMSAIGTKNRNFLYRALEAYLVSVQLPSDPEADIVIGNSEDIEPEVDVIDVRKATDTSVFVRLVQGGVEEKHTLTVDKRGNITNMPVEWLTNPGRKRTLAIKEVISQTTALFKKS